MNYSLKSISLATLALVAFGASAETFPTKPISIVVPFAAGGPTDKVARDLAKALTATIPNSTVVVENVPGAGSTIGIAKVASAQADGHTILLNHIGMSTIPSLYRKLSFDISKDFEYLGIINDVPMTLIGRPSLPANNYAELTKWLSANKGKINLGNAGLGSASHLCGLMFQSALNTEMQTVAYKGTAPAINDLMGGHIDLLCDQTTNTSGQIEGKTVKAFGVTTLKTLTTKALSHLPTLHDSGLSGFNVTIWHGLYAPKGTPAAVLKTINDGLKAALKNPEFIASQEALGAVVATDARVNPAEHKRFVESETKTWGAVIKASGSFAD